MPRTNRVQIPTVPNPDISKAFNYEARRGRPMLFQVMKPNILQPLYTTFLALHVNPSSIDERMTKSKNVVMTYGGWVEFVWADELTTLSASGSTGAFFSPETGLTAGNERSSRSYDNYDASGRSKGATVPGRRGTIAWERKEDLLELFRMNGCVYNSVGQPSIRGRVMLIYDRGIFIGHFTSFEEAEDGDHPYTFELSWEFRIEQTIYKIPDTVDGTETGSQFFAQPTKAAAEGR